MKLYGYFRSSAAYRVRIALNFKQIQYENEFCHLRKNEQHSENFRKLNPQGLLPVLDDNGLILTQSVAIMEYLEEKYPEPALLPGNSADRAYVRSIMLAIACDTHPLNNLRVLRYLNGELKLDEENRNTWYRHWIATEFTALEAKLLKDGKHGKFCYGDSPTLADICLVPQVNNARRFDCDLTSYPILTEIDRNCRMLKEVKLALPEHQPDAE